MKKLNSYLLTALIAGSSMFAVSCGKDDPEPVDPPINKDLEEYSMNEKWVNYLVASTSELRDDCIRLWAAWAGPSAVSGEDLARIGSNFWSANELGNGFANTIKTAGQSGNSVYLSQTQAIEEIIKNGCENIAGEVGEQKIGGPNGLAKSGKASQAVLEVESWYSWNSIKDYSDNIISIRSSYFGKKGAASAQEHSISSFVKSKNADLDNRIIAAINNAYNAISGMQAPFRNNLTGTKVDAAMDACADLVEIFAEVYPLLNNNAGGYDFTLILQNYADQVVVPTYKEMKEKAWAMYNAAVAFKDNQSNQQLLNNICVAWRENRIPWEQSEAFLFGPADKLGLDPSLDSWPLDQDDIAGILKNSNITTPEQIIGAISGESVRGFHTIELLLFKDGQNRTVR